MKFLVAALALGLLTAVPGFAKDPAYTDYRKQVDRESNKNYRANQGTIDPSRERGRAGGKDLDHSTSVKSCYKSGTSASACADTSNLRMLESSQNRREGCREVGCRK